MKAEEVPEKPLQIDSLIIKQGDYNKGQHLKLLRESFGQPIQLQRIFRASENGFKAAAFHQKCDNLEDTLVLVKTQFGSIIGGFSHYKWNAANSTFVHNEGKQAFLLSFDKGEKYVPQNGQKLIECHPHWGPKFGAGHDLAIADNCNTANGSYANFPTTYNRESNKIANSMQSCKDFSGAIGNKYFRVEEYEVFRVLFE
jgi:hypothetical protein